MRFFLSAGARDALRLLRVIVPCGIGFGLYTCGDIFDVATYALTLCVWWGTARWTISPRPGLAYASGLGFGTISVLAVASGNRVVGYPDGELFCLEPLLLVLLVGAVPLFTSGFLRAQWRAVLLAAFLALASASQWVSLGARTWVARRTLEQGDPTRSSFFHSSETIIASKLKDHYIDGGIQPRPLPSAGTPC